MTPFNVRIQPGTPVYQQVVFAVRKAIVSGEMAPGDPFPSVRQLSKDLKINPNTAHRVVANLVGDGLLEVHSGIGTVVAQGGNIDVRMRTRILDQDLERLVVDAKRVGLDLDQVSAALGAHWQRLQPPEEGET